MSGVLRRSCPACDGRAEFTVLFPDPKKAAEKEPHYPLIWRCYDCKLEWPLVLASGRSL